MFGYLPLAPRALLTTFEEQPEIETVGVAKRGKRKVMPIEKRAFPENVRFKKADWVNEKLESDRKGYDVILAFSITKWIHLNGLNEGLFKFFSRCFKSLLPGGKLILEPQPFSSYSKAAKFSEELKMNFGILKDGELLVDPEEKLKDKEEVEEGNEVDGEPKKEEKTDEKEAASEQDATAPTTSEPTPAKEERRGPKGWRYEDGDFQRVLLEEIGFEKMEVLGETGEDGFKRKVEVYWKRAGSFM